MKIAITSRWSARVLFEAEIDDATAPRFRLRAALQIAVGAKADLSGADLSDAVLRGADLSGADLSDAVLSDADLRGADLRGADLRDAVLSGADLSGAVLSDAVLSGADLSDADLRGADLRGADLRDAVLSDADLSDADLSDADLSGADLSDAKEDLERVLSTAPAEAGDVLAALRAGRIDGTVYDGACACLVGTIAKARGVYFGTLDHDASRPIERLFTAILPGDTPDNHPVARIVAGWIEEWIAAHPSAAPAPEAA